MPITYPEIFSLAFIKYAIIGSLLASVLCAMVGTYIVTRRMVITGGGIAHASLGGVGLGAYLGISPTLGAIGFALLSGLGIDAATQRWNVREDSAIAIFWTFGMSLGILFAYMTPGFMTDLPNYLFGDILSISAANLVWLTLLMLVCSAVFFFWIDNIILVAYDPDFARTLRVPVRAIEITLLVLTVLTIVACIQTVGIVLVISLLSVPQTAALLFTRTFRQTIILSAVLSFAGCLGGLLLSVVFDVPSGACIILVTIAIYAVLRAIKSVYLRLKKV